MFAQVKQQLKLQIPLVILLICSYSPLFSQLLWPGDINNNGEVNMVDMLYYGIARDVQGPERDDEGTDWYGYTPPDPWEDLFGDNINFCQADVDGKGKVDKKDRDAILKNNYGFTHGTVIPDFFPLGNPSTDPQLLIVPQDNAVEPKKKLKVDVFLGDAVRQVNGIFGIAFRLHFDPELVDDEKESDLHKPKKVKFKLKGNTWLNAGGGAKAEDYIRVNNAGWVDVAIMRKEVEDGYASGYGEIGTFEIVMEDIVLYGDETETLHLSVDRIKMIDVNMNEFPVVQSFAEVLVVEDDHGYLVQNPDDDGIVNEQNELGTADRAEQVEEVELRDLHQDRGLRLYPNPFNEVLVIAYDHEHERLEQVEIFNNLGQLIYHQSFDRNDVKEALDMSRYQNGSYWVRVTTSDGVSSHLISK